ncbi:FYVE, RhoGEF and PH domain-containing protein 6 [Trichosurus vulpecula]|uniref:FYVE, RhoGEF and PH domain-containing protein 6 n=1 Tax=Trichosurus vulpecula TaxID=9337 RepID=UPI00186B19B1|nr:FYVE, RhoGEF and PH domain-containing protein 6 [Trichosurus vulpecula]
MGGIMNSSAETKKPPLAPKPKFLVGSKPAPPPIAPKPDVVVSNVLLSTKTSKPAIAPKPKVPKGSPDTRLSLSRKNLVLLEEHKQESSEHSDKLKCQNGDDRAPYILPVCSSNTECIHNCGNGDNSCVKHIVLEHLETLENLENINIGDPLSVPKAKKKCDAHSEKVGNRNQVVLKASLLEEKLKDVFFTPIGSSPTTSPLKHRPTNSLEMDGSCDANVGFNFEIAALSHSLSGFDEVPQTRDCHVKFPGDGIQITETSQDCVEVSINGVCSSDQEAVENDRVSSVQLLEGESQKSEAEEVTLSGKPSAPCNKSLPALKSRMPRTARLMRQAYVDAPSESNEDLGNSQEDSSSPIEQHVKKSNQITPLGSSILCDHDEPDKKEEQRSKNLLTSDSGNRKCTNLTASEGQDVAVYQSAVSPQTSHKVERVEDYPPADFSLHLEDNTVADGNVSPHVDRRASFIKCNKQSMSLPTQLKPTYNQHLPAPNSLHGSPSKTDKEATISNEGPIKIAPKKPQRHSLPAAGRLKKAASEELLENSSYPSDEERSSEGILDKSCLRHFATKEHGMSSSFDMPKLIKASEKPVWKLPHPILPFPGNPESLKSTNLSSNSESFPSLTKPRAKSLSAVDMDRCNKPCKDPQKKNSLKKLLNMKLSICFTKSDFQRFLSKSIQVGEAAPARLSSREGRGLDNSQQVDEKRSKPVKAHSADTHSPASHKKRRMYRSQVDLPNGPKAESLDDQMLSRETPSTPFSSGASDCAPEYENICHYEETPEYENLPFTLTTRRTPDSEWQNPNTMEDSEANAYEIEDPYIMSSSQLQQTPGPLHSRSSHEDHSDLDLTLGDIPSDEEEAINSSDEDASSDSSKGEPDSLEDKQGKGTGKRSKVYLIAKEIMSSEKVFVDVLKLLHIDFRDAVAQASRQLGKPVIEDRILNQILYYLPQLYELNRDLLKELEERMLNWIEQQRIADIFVKKGPYLKMYSTYIKEFDKNLALLDEQCKKNPGFATVVKDFEMSPRCASLAIKHYLLKPVQRIPQYRLLLTDYLNNLLEDSADYRDTQDALAVVIEVANHANEIMKQGDNFQKLMQIQYSLSGHHEIVQPGRVFLKEGTLMKLSRKVMQPRMFFLFNDALLYTTPVQSGMYKLNNMLSLAGMKVRKPTQEAYQNELKIESVERSFILSASSATERDEWLKAISQSIEEYAKKKITFCPSRSLDETDMDKKEEMSPLGSKAPIWIPDTRATMCMVCTSEFTLTWRRHHCRACGKIVCQACSSNKYGLDYLKNQPARVCEHCFKELQKLDHQNSPKTGSPANHKSPSSALSSVLHSIPSGRKQKKIPAALKEVSANTEDSTMSGYLYRSKGSKKPWKHFWFVIKNKVLYTYAASEDVAALESQPLLGFTVAEVQDENSQSKVFQLLHKNVLFYIFKADDAHSAQKWIEAFQEGTVL